WQVIHEAREVYGPWRVNCHLIVGIGETDKEMVEVLYSLREKEVLAYFFAFYPEEGSVMERRKRPSLARYRRLQLVKHLIEEEGLRPGQIIYDEKDRIAGLRAPRALVDQAIEQGKAFVTGGCPSQDGDLGCTRPFANSRPGEPFRNYPFRPEPGDILDIRRRLRLATNWRWE
ncbi:MAG TPA: radical SAM protein, partial [Dehalococcoidia bacterium]|nr:radical SAM protein [Dehalococcoidia bacterium]